MTVQVNRAVTGTYERRKPRRWPSFRLALPVAFFIFLVIIWQVCVTLFNVPVFLLPGPLRIASAAASNWGSLEQAVLYTFVSFLIGFLLSVVIGVALAIFMAQTKLIEATLYPYAIFLQTIPVVSVAPIIIVWLGPGRLSIAVIAFIVSVFPIIANTTAGLASTEHNLVNMMELYQANRWQMLWKLRIPYALPYIATGLKIASGGAVIGAIVAEYQAGVGGGQGGLGYEITVAANQLRMDYLFAAAIASCLMGLLIFLIVSGIAKLLLKNWHESSVRFEN